MHLQCRPAKSRKGTQSHNPCSVLWLLLLQSSNTNTSLEGRSVAGGLDLPKKTPKRSTLNSIILISENLQGIVLWHSRMENVVWIENNFPLLSPISVILETVNGTKIRDRLEEKEGKVRMRIVAQRKGLGSCDVWKTKSDAENKMDEYWISSPLSVVFFSSFIPVIYAFIWKCLNDFSLLQAAKCGICTTGFSNGLRYQDAVLGCIFQVQ